MTSMTTFQKNSDIESGVSLCIPFVFKHITKERVFAVFKAQRVGHIERIDIVEKDEKHNRVYIHFAKGKWGHAYFNNAMDILLNLKANIPWIVPYSKNGNGYWKVWISQSEKPENIEVARSAPRVKRRQRLDLSESKPVPSSIVLDLNDPIQARIASTSPPCSFPSSYYE